MSKTENQNSVASSCIVATIIGEYNSQYTSLSLVPSNIVRNFIGENYISSAASELSNLFTPFANKINADKSGLIIPTFELVGKETDFNAERSGEIDYEDPDGLDFACIPNVTLYNDIKFLTYGTIPTVGSDAKSAVDLNEKDFEYQDIRGVGFKFPMFAAGFGYDMTGRPVPSLYDEEFATANSGCLELENSLNSGDILRTERNKNTFMDRVDSYPKFWKSGPVDCRWDRYRKVWSASPVIVQGYMADTVTPPSGHATDLKFTSGEMILFDGQYDGWKKIQPEQRALIVNRSVSLTIESGTYCVAQWMPNGEFRPIWLDCAPDPSGSWSKEKGQVYWPHTSGEIEEEEEE